jgi:5,10-methylene-tetrahydrofolate dehydrogenase/methenyl tetrahydrofolate cyclohydrolase
MKDKTLDNNTILIVSKFVGKPLLLRMLLAGKQSTLLHNH